MGAVENAALFGNGGVRMSAVARGTLPYQPRTLGLHELQAEDVYSFYSPKCGRLVRVIGLPRLLVALELEFDPSVEVFIERPRTLVVDQKELEFSWWHRHRSGREHLTLVVRAPETVMGSGGRARHRQAEALLASAEAARLPLRFVFEAEMPLRGARATNQFRLLPSVQGAHRLSSRQALRQRVLEVVSTRERLRVDQIEQQLGGFSTADLSCGLADLIHSGEVGIDWDKPLGASSLTWRIES